MFRRHARRALIQSRLVILRRSIRHRRSTLRGMVSDPRITTIIAIADIGVRAES
jgi:hypothetical protein